MREPECTCDRRELDAPDEHYLLCPVICTPEVWALLGLVPREADRARS